MYQHILMSKVQITAQTEDFLHLYSAQPAPGTHSRPPRLKCRSKKATAEEIRSALKDKIVYFIVS